MINLFYNISSLVQISNSQHKYKIGTDMRNINEIQNGAILFDEKILWVGKSEEVADFINKNKLEISQSVDLSGKTLIPGFTDPHTHIIFGGNRSNEFARRLEGATYIEIAKEGGGILSTVRATREATLDELVMSASKLIENAIKNGTIALEIKSGYGLNTETEIKMLEAIDILKRKYPIYIKSTFLGAHDFPPEYKDNRDEYVDLLCEEMLPKVAEKNLAEYCDAFVDKGYYTLEQGKKIFTKAKELGMKIRMHCDELADVNAAKLAAELGAISADHLLFVNDESLVLMQQKGTVATLLPGTSFFIRMPYANARKIIDMGVITALATDCNPGSSFTENMQMILWLAAINLKMTAEEALTAATLNSAYSLQLSDKVGSIEPGKDASFLILNINSYKELFYHFGHNHVEKVYINGKPY
ncbi:MAG: imidazolonepropionase [Candidatus Kapaibacteriota bacterium]